MGVEANPTCPNCRRLQAQLDVQHAQLETQRVQLDTLRTQLDVLQRTMSQLQAQLAAARKDSSTSSKPPSSDIVKPPKPPPPTGQDKRQGGGQPGHPKQERPAFPPEALTAPAHEYYPPEICPDCGLGLRPAGDAPRVIQQMDIAIMPLLVEEHRSYAGWCPNCCKVHYAALPVDVERAG